MIHAMKQTHTKLRHRRRKMDAYMIIRKEVVSYVSIWCIAFKIWLIARPVFVVYVDSFWL